ncbi:MAG: serine/threonine-protein kinase [Myxococcaceae bacterium]
MAQHGRYSLLRKIADGGTGEVFLANMEGSAGFKRMVVLKRVKPNLWADQKFREMLIDEAHISMALHHSNIVQVLDLGVAGGRYFLAFELVDGWTLSQIVTRARKAGMEIPQNLALHVMAETCRALAYAHGKTQKGEPMGIVHRDVTPQNVLLSEQGEVKLSDFGIAKAASRLTVSQIGQVKGKPAFMSPEQATGLELDGRSDLFAVGVMLYWLLVGELPFLGATDLESLAKVARGQFTPPEKKKPDLQKPLLKLITKALERDVKKRFQNAEEMLAELESIQRKVLTPAGQTELKAWLSELAKKDNQKPISHTDATLPPMKLQEEDSQPIELIDESDFVAVTTQPAEGLPARMVVPPAGPAEGAGGRILIGVISLGLVSAGAWYLLRPKEQPVATLPSVDARPDAGLTVKVIAVPEMRLVVDAAVPEAADAAVEEPADAAVEVADAAVVEPEAVDAAVPEVPAPAPAPVPVKAAPAPVPVVKPPPAAPPTADETMISVTIDSEPKGADVAIDKRVFGKTPIPLRLKIGIQFELTVSKPGYKTQKVMHLVTKRAGQRVLVNLAK